MSSPGSSPALPRERELIEHIRGRIPTAPAGLIVGPTDDAAVYAPERGAFQVITTDCLIEGVHFERRFSAWSDIGYKALAINLSDIAAMGAAPHLALLSLCLPESTTLRDVDDLLEGFLELAAATRVALAGGNISRSPGGLVVDVTAVGYVRPRRFLTRRGGRPGDALYLTGTIGAAAAGLDWLKTRDETLRGEAEPKMAACVLRHRRPEPRTRVGALLGRNRAASACMDLSDGLADAVRQVAVASGTGARVDASLLPVDPAASRWFTSRDIDPIEAALTGGDDFELLFSVPGKVAGRLRHVVSGARGLSITRIGELTADSALVVERGGRREPLPEGYEHFAGR